MDSQNVLMMSVLVSIMVVLFVGAVINKTSAKRNHIFDVQCEIAGQVKSYQVEKIRYDNGVIRFEIDDKKIECSHFFVQEVTE